MPLGPLLAAPVAARVHAGAALAALALGIWQVMARKRGARHRRVRWIRAALMLAVVLSSFAITRGLFLGALLATGGFTLLPGRIMGAWLSAQR